MELRKVNHVTLLRLGACLAVTGLIAFAGCSLSFKTIEYEIEREEA